MFYFKQKYI